MSTAAPATAAAWALAGALYRVANHTEVPEATLLNLCWNLVHLWTIQENSKAHARGTAQPRPPETRGAIFASLEGSDLPSSGSSRGLQQRAQSPPRSRVATYPRAEDSSSVLNLRLARG